MKKHKNSKGLPRVSSLYERRESRNLFANRQEVNTMMYRFCKRSGGGWVELECSDRHEIRHWIEDHVDELQTFAVHESGNIYGYAVELSDKGKPVAILYPHKIAQLIWIDMN